MKKQLVALTLILALMLLAPACKKKAAAPAAAGDMLAMVPDGAMMLMSFDFQRFASLRFFDKALKDDWRKTVKGGEGFENYQEFVQKTGIDLQKDVHFVVAAVYGGLEQKDTEALGLVSLKYDPAKLLAVLREKGAVSAEEPYAGLTLYTLKNDKGDKPMTLAFLNPGCVAAGSAGWIKKTVDLADKKGQSVLKNPGLMKYVNGLDKKSMFWLALGNIPRQVKEAQGGMMPVDLSKAEAFTAVADFKDQVLAGELRLISANEAGNKQIADMLNGFKAMAAMGAAKEPELAELLNGLQLDSAPDHVRLTFRLSEALLDKLGEKAKTKAQGMMPPAMPGAGEGEEVADE